MTKRALKLYSLLDSRSILFKGQNYKTSDFKSEVIFSKYSLKLLTLVHFQEYVVLISDSKSEP